MSNKSFATKDSVVRYTADHSLRLHPVQRELIEFTMSSEPDYRMLGATDAVQLMSNLMRAIGAKRYVEVGTYTGYSALSAALALPPDGVVVALDISEHYTNLAKPFWAKAGVADKIDLRIAPAIESLDKLVSKGAVFDFAFIDADKENYAGYYERCLQLMRPGGIIAIDNTLWSNSVMDPSDQRSSTVSLRSLNTALKDDARVHISFLTIGDGLTLLFKK